MGAAAAAGPARSAQVGVVGAGYGGLSAALSLCRHRFDVVVFDGGPPRNAASTEVHGYLGAPNTSAREMLAVARDQVTKVGGRIVPCRIETVEREGDGFRLRAGETAEAGEWQVERLVLATGVRDEKPEIVGLERYFGRSVHVCPHCDGYEWRDLRVVVISSTDAARDFASKVSHWTRHVTVVIDGTHPVEDEARAVLARRGIAIADSEVVAFEGSEETLEGVRLADGRVLPAAAAFFSIGEVYSTELAEQLGCRIGESGSIATDGRMHTTEEGVWAVGDVAGDSQFVAVAVAQGLKAALDIHRTLEPRDPEAHPA